MKTDKVHSGRKAQTANKLSKSGRKARHSGKTSWLGSIFRNWQSKFGSLIIAIFIYSFYQVAIQAEVSFVLPLRTIGDQNRIVNLLDVRQVTLQLSGRTQDLENLRSSDFETYVRLNPNEDGMQSLPVLYRLRNNDLQLSKNVTVHLKPNFVSLLVEKEITRSLPIEVSLQGYPATGYNLGSYSVYPDSVSVTGPASVLQQLAGISTEVIDITGKSEPFQELVKLELPVLPDIDKTVRDNLQLAFDKVQIEVQIDVRSETRSFSIVPQVSGLPSNLQLLNMLPGVVRLTVQGNSDILQRLATNPEILRIELDGGDIYSSGRYALPVVVSGLPLGISLLNSSPDRISVVVGER